LSSGFTKYVTSSRLLVSTCYGYNTSMMSDAQKNKSVLDAHSPIPLYYQLKNWLEEKIDAGDYHPGDQIPSENQLCDQHGISRTTTRQAINLLVSAGKLTRTQGRGTFVNKSRIEKPTFRLAGFNHDMHQIGIKPGSEILQFTPILPPPQVITKLQMKENEAAVFVEILRFADDKIVGIDRSYFAFKRFLKLLDEDLCNKSLYQVLRTKFNTHPTRHSYHIEACRCPREIADNLDIDPSGIVLHVVGTTYDQNDMPFEFSDEYYRADRFSFRAEIQVGDNERFGGFHT